MTSPVLVKSACRVMLPLLWVLACALPAAAAGTAGAQPVVLLHGLARSESSMQAMADALQAGGFKPCLVPYPSRVHPVEELAAAFVLPRVLQCAGVGGDTPVAFVTHSLGGILVRQLEATGAPIRFGRVVMLGPPNAGSQVVDKLGGWAPFGWINGPAGGQLGTDAASVPVALGATQLEVGVIAGRRSVNPILSLLIPGEDDGKVAVDRARIDGMRDFLVVPVSHPFLMKHPMVIAQSMHFLRTGRFARDTR